MNARCFRHQHHWMAFLQDLLTKWGLTDVKRLSINYDAKEEVIPHLAGEVLTATPGLRSMKDAASHVAKQAGQACGAMQQPSVTQCEGGWLVHWVPQRDVR